MIAPPVLARSYFDVQELVDPRLFDLSEAAFFRLEITAVQQNNILACVCVRASVCRLVGRRRRRRNLLTVQPPLCAKPKGGKCGTLEALKFVVVDDVLS